MVKTEIYNIEKKMSMQELDQRIKSLEKDVKVLKRLYFVKNRYLGDSVEVAAKKIGVTKRVGYIWQERWNAEGYDGLIPKYAGGRPSKLTEDQKEELKKILDLRDDWTTKEIRNLVKNKYGVKYTSKQIRVILRSFKMHCAKPFPHDYRQPEDAAEILKKD